MSWPPDIENLPPGAMPTCPLITLIPVRETFASSSCRTVHFAADPNPNAASGTHSGQRGRYTGGCSAKPRHTIMGTVSSVAAIRLAITRPEYRDRFIELVA